MTIKRNSTCALNLVSIPSVEKLNMTDDCQVHETGSQEAESYVDNIQYKGGAKIFWLTPELDVVPNGKSYHGTADTYRDCVCNLCEKTVSLALDIPLAGLQSKRRCNADVALARQIAMYLCRTLYGLPLTEVGLHFSRDRTTVAHACHLVEDKRDEMAFDVLLSQLEALLCDARHAMNLCVQAPRDVTNYHDYQDLKGDKILDPSGRKTGDGS